MKIKFMVCILVVFLMITQWDYSSFQQVSAAMKNGEMVTLTKAGQVLETITFHGKTVEAVYSNESYASNDLTYSCAAFIKKFYKEIYGIQVYNLSTPKSIPLIYNSVESFSETSTPQIGDIVRDNVRTHWAIVKSIDGNTITVIQQNYKSGTTAWINCSTTITDTRYTYFTYSNRVNNENNMNGNSEQKEPDNIVQEPSPDSAIVQIQAPVQVINPNEAVTNITQQESGEGKPNSDFISQEQQTPSVTISNKTLYTGYKSYRLKFNKVQADDQLFFASSDTAVVKVSNKGTLTPVGKGTAFISILIKQGENYYQQSVEIKVKDPYLKITNSITQVGIGESVQYTAKAYGMEDPVVWSVLDNNIAEIDHETGLFTAKKKGTVTVIADCNGSLETKIRITIQ